MEEQPFTSPAGEAPGISAGPTVPGVPAEPPAPGAPTNPGAPTTPAPPYWQQQASGANWPVTPLAVPASDHQAAPRRRLVLGMTVAVGLAVAFGAGLATGRATAPRSAAPSALAGTKPNPGATIPSAGTASSASTPANGGSVLTAGQLTGALIPLPAGAKALSVSSANADGSMSLDQFVNLLYAKSSSEKTLLQARGFERAATRWMRTAGGQEDCFYLIVFGSTDGAQSYTSALEKAHEDDTADASETKFAVPALSDGQGFETATLDSYGNADSEAYGFVGNVAIIVHSFTPAALNRSEMLGLVDQQASRLSADESAP